MTIERLRRICLALPDATEDVKWGSDLCFSVRKKMFVVVNLEPPHDLSFKCTPERFAELVERPGIVPSPFLARHMWVREQELGEALDARELEALVRASYDLIVAKLPKSKRPGASASRATRSARGHPRSGSVKRR
jgi:predicted DNA-binding protein (MmcQ/YjbR family)